MGNLTTVLRPGMDAQEPLRQLRRVVEEIDDDRLHMSVYAEKAECGTAYCAAGAAAVDPWFREYTRINKILQVTEDRLLLWDVPDDSDYDSMGEALADVFLLDEDDAVMLFALDTGGNDLDAHDISKAEVLANIDRLLAGREAETYDACLESDEDDDLDEDEDEDDDLDDLEEDDDVE